MFRGKGQQLKHKTKEVIKMTKSEIFSNAWAIAKSAHIQFGGNVKEYFSESLKLAYKLSAKTVAVAFTLNMAGGSKKHKSWVAKINGEDAKWGFNRTFIDAVDYGVWSLADGVYNIKDASKNEQEFILIKNGEAVEIEKEEVLSFV